jgi:hypothetical protein
MRKLIGKIRQSIRAARNKRIPRSTSVRPAHGMLDHVRHYHASGETRYLCGKFYDRETQHTGNARPALSFEDVSCNRCQRVHGLLLKTPGGRKRLGLDKYAARPVRA